MVETADGRRVSVVMRARGRRDCGLGSLKVKMMMAWVDFGFFWDCERDELYISFVFVSR